MTPALRLYSESAPFEAGPSDEEALVADDATISPTTGSQASP